MKSGADQRGRSKDQTRREVIIGGLVTAGALASSSAWMAPTAARAAPSTGSVYWDINIPEAAHQFIGNVISGGNTVQVIAFPPHGGWVAVASDRAYEAHGIPQNWPELTKRPLGTHKRTNPEQNKRMT